MKRLWIGVFLLAVLLVLSWIGTGNMVSSSQNISSALEEAAVCALRDNWDRAGKLLREATSLWEEKWPVAAIFADHEPMEQIDGLFSQAEVWSLLREKGAFAAACRELAREIHAIGDAHSLSWQNLF